MTPRQERLIMMPPQELMRMEMIAVDAGRDQALAFVRELRRRIAAETTQGMKSHMDV